MTQRLQSRTWSWLTKITGTAIVTTVFIYCLADAYAALPRLVFGIIATSHYVCAPNWQDITLHTPG